jgi:hypothetical protein
MEGGSAERCGRQRLERFDSLSYVPLGLSGNRIALNVITVNLQKPKIVIPDVALGAPVEQSMLHFLPFYFAMMLISHSSFAPSQRIVRANDSVIYPIDSFCRLAVIEAWNMKYIGDAYKALLAAIDAVHVTPIQNNYAKILPVTQSSGTGKSKTVDRIAEERILIPLCLREGLDQGFGA